MWLFWSTAQLLFIHKPGRDRFDLKGGCRPIVVLSHLLANDERMLSALVTKYVNAIRSDADMPRRPVIAQVGDTPIRPTAQQMRRSAGSGAAAAARRATTLERQATEAAARAGDAILAAREADAVVLARAAAQLTIADDSMDEIDDETADEAPTPEGTSAAAPAAEASGAAEIGNGDDEADVEATNTEHEPGESDAATRRDGEGDGGRLVKFQEGSLRTRVPMREPSSGGPSRSVSQNGSRHGSVPGSRPGAADKGG